MNTTVAIKQIHQEIHSLRDELQSFARILRQSNPSMLYTDPPYIVRVEGIRGGEPIVRGTGISVRTIVERIRLNETPEQIASAYPPLSLSQVYAALSYYYDHPQEIEAYIAENEAAMKIGCFENNVLGIKC